MATAKQIAALAKKIMVNGSVIISGADYDEERLLARLQVYFWDEKEAVMDIITPDDLIQNWPDEGVYAINVSGDEQSALIPVRKYEGSDNIYLRISEEDLAKDDLGELPGVVVLEALELICQLR